MISADLAQDLALAGLRWSPAPGDRFAIAADGLSEVFTVSEMTVEVHDYPTGRVLGFNGTTEWALDSVTIDQALWFPSEEQLRTLLGGTFRSLVRTDADGEGRFTVMVDVRGGVEEFVAADAAEAYGLALHSLVAAATGDVVEGQPTWPST